MKALRLTYLVSHPIQYQVPLLRRLARQSRIHLKVLFEREANPKGSYDQGFGRNVAWDVDLISGYNYSVVSDVEDLNAHIQESDVLWCHGWSTYLSKRALVLAKNLGVPVLMRAENNDVSMPDGRWPRSWLKRQYIYWIFRQCNAFLYIGTANRDYYLKRGIPEKSLFPVPYAVDNAFFIERMTKCSANRRKFRRSLGLDNSTPVILYAGKFTKRKCPDALARAALRLKRDFYLLFVGDGELRSEIEACATKSDGRIRILGFKNQTELPAFYDLADIFVLAGSREPWGLAINEAMLGAAAIVTSTETGCATDLLTNGIGRIVPPNHEGALVAALDDLLSDPERLAEMGQASQTLIKNWSFDADIEGILKACDAVRM